MISQMTTQNVHRNGKPVPVPVSYPNGVPKGTPDDSYYAESILGRFGWIAFGVHYVPFIVRVENGKNINFISKRIAEAQVLSNYLCYLSTDVHKCPSIRFYPIINCEAKILNEINFEHCDEVYGKNMFVAEKDYIFSLDDLREYYLFLSMCFNSLTNSLTSYRKLKCGFIRINSESVVPYSIKDNKKYVPLFYFEGQTDKLRHLATKLENWDLAYLKFLFKFIGLRENVYDGDSCLAISLNEIKTHFDPSIVFEEIWPNKVINESLLNNHTDKVMMQQTNNIPSVKVATIPISKAQIIRNPPSRTN